MREVLFVDRQLFTGLFSGTPALDKTQPGLHRSAVSQSTVRVWRVQ